ncbi:MAG: hypothetical protein LBH51_07310 [Treponema sp.]|nr:hypothetical protein [Treponema sp.]
MQARITVVKKRFFSGALCLIMLILRSRIPLSAQSYFRGFTELLSLETRYFEIIYPKESEETARRLALYADGAYEEVSTRLGISVDRTIPVAITPHIDEFNGFMNSMPYPHILLLDTFMDSEWTTFDNSLEKLFLHEMTHAVSMSTRGRVVDFFYRIFGGWVYPPIFNAPSFMIEGISVSFESLTGYGRTVDPLVRQKLRQENYDGKFLSPYQVSGVSDLKAAATGAWYEYGGLFSRYLQENYGMEKYAELWRRLGGGFHFSIFFYRNGFYHFFKQVYGVSVEEAWNGMRESLALEGLEDSAGMAVRRGLPFKMRDAPSHITGMAAAGEKVFVLDRFARHLFVYNGGEEKTELIVPVRSSAYDVAVHAGGERFLVSSYRYSNSRAEAEVIEYSSGNGRAGRTWRGLYRGSYFRDGVVGIDSEGYRSRIVFRTGNPAGGPAAEPEDSRSGEILLEGGGDLSFTNPRPLNDRWIAFTAARRGKRELCFYDYESRRVYRAAADLPDDEARWEFIRYLQVSGGRLLFGYDHDDRMYKLGVIDFRALENAAGPALPEGAALGVVFTERDFSGAVAFPVLAGSEIYYSGAFFDSDRLMRYPQGLEDLDGVSADLYLLPWDSGSPPDAESPPEGGLSGSSPESLSPSGGSALPSRVYLPFKYMNPFSFWFPIPLIRSDPDTVMRLDGGGIYSLMVDPAELNTVVLQAFMDARFMSANFNVHWTNTNLGFPLSVEISDGVAADTEPYRALRFTVESTLSRSLGPRGFRGFLGAGFGFSQFFTGNLKSSAYSWDARSNSYSVVVSAGITSLSVRAWESFGRGATFQLTGRLLSAGERTNSWGLHPRLEGYVRSAFEPTLPFRFTLYGAWDAYWGGMNLQGASSQYPNPIFQSVSVEEYQNQEIRGLAWIAGGEAELRIFSMNVEKGISHIYVNRFLGTLAYRTAVYDSGGFSAPEGNRLGGDLRAAQSLVLRLGGELSSIIFTTRPIRMSVYVQTALRLSRLGQGQTGFADIIAITPMFNASY